ncbi:chaperonin 10-like protein [Xylogone sp. PMI_703]|nr:chaperonin 10-like protein [Xylogone sp. PMI_703]
MAANIPETMLACQVVEYNKPYKIHTVPTPKPSQLKPWEMLVRVAVASLCHTDFMLLSGIFTTDLPCTGSHEGAGTVAAVGSSITDFKIGDRILCGLTYGRCGQCEDCTGPDPQTQYCRFGKASIGIARDGNFADYVVIDGREASHLPDNLSFRSAAPFACAGITIWGGLVKAALQPGQWVAIVGAGGGLGHLGVQFAKAQGLKVIGIDARDEGLQLCRDCGADVTLDARQGTEAVAEMAQKATSSTGADVTINVSDHPTAAALAAAVTKIHGRMIQIAQPDEVTVPFREFIFRDVTIQGSLTANRREAQRMLACVVEKGIRVKTVAFNGLEEIPKLIELVETGKLAGKGVVLIDREATSKETEGML